ncbi:MAG: hypothetical protein H6Q99_1459 [Proteobacteria bacterium]|nr:hypothetical protein [Pseudomonadota bacterium]
MLANREQQCQTAGMRFLAGLRLLIVAAALIGLLAGPSVVVPVAHAAMSAVADTSHDCCGKTTHIPSGKAGPADTCLGPGCPMAAPALLPVAPVVIVTAERPADASPIVAGLEGRSLPPLLGPPRA